MSFAIVFSFVLLKAQDKTSPFNSINFNELYEYGVKNFSTGNIEESENYFLEALKIKPNDITILKYLAEIAVANKNLIMISYYYDKVLTLDSRDEDALISLGVIHLNYGNIKRAKEFLLEAVNNEPKNELALFNLSILYGTIGEYSTAVNALKKLISYNPYNAKYYETIGMYYLSQNLFSDAEDNFLEALRYDKNLIESRKGLVILYQNQSELNESLKYIKELETLIPDLQDLNILKAYQQYLQGEIETAIKYALQENEEYPEEPDAYYLLSDLYKITGNELKSRYYLERAKKLNKDYSAKTVYSFLNIK
jgi:tetratricopeptide (TPR) repeat protein